jgi:serralysin
VFAGNRSTYTITTSGGVTTVTGADGTDRLIFIERLQFSDQVVTLSSAPLGEGESAIILDDAFVV